MPNLVIDIPDGTARWKPPLLIGFILLMGVRESNYKRDYLLPEARSANDHACGSTQTTETSIDDPYIRYYCHFDADIGEWPLFHAEKNYTSVIRLIQIQ